MIKSGFAQLNRWSHYPEVAYNQFREGRRQRDKTSTNWQWSSLIRLDPSIKTGYTYCISIVAGILILNLIVAVWAATGHHLRDGLTLTLYQGQCSTAKQANFWVHLLVNICASSLFCASTYIMQRLCAPSRRDLDVTHRSGKSMKIGSLTVINLALMSNARLAVFMLLWASSLPIHLMYNSLIVYTTTNSEWASYAVLIQAGDLPEPGRNATLEQLSARTQYGLINETNEVILTQYLINQQPPLERMDVQACIQAYASGANEVMGDVLLVTNTQFTYTPTTTLRKPYDHFGSAEYGTSGRGTYFLPWGWLCYPNQYSYKQCQPANLVKSGSWSIMSHPIDHCLVRKFKPACELNMSLSIMIAVLVCNTGKLLAMVLAVLLNRDKPLVTIGDAVSSFLENEDETTKGMSVAEAEFFPGYFDDDIPLSKAPSALIRRDRKARISSEISGAYWWSNIFGITALGLAFGFFGWTFRQSKSQYEQLGYNFTASTMWELGLGDTPPLYTSSQYSKIMRYSGDESSNSYVSGAVQTNLPQLALSFLYLLYNNYFTRIFLTFEGRSFARCRRGLRVSQPVRNSAQRGTYFFQFPLHWSLLFIAYFVITHTFLSESLFLRRTYALFPVGLTGDETSVGKVLESRIGFSPLAIFILSILLLPLVGFAVGIGWWKVDWIFPCTNGDSRAISAACHPPKVSKNVHLGPVRWGVTSRSIDGTGNCSFSLLPVRMPDIGEKFG